MNRTISVLGYIVLGAAWVGCFLIGVSNAAADGNAAAVSGAAAKSVAAADMETDAATSSAAGESAAADVATNAAGAPVLMELFTSEGCSSCPPADKMLGQIDEMQPITGEHVIVLGEHVDYWNHDGWKDAYSSAYFTQRQTDYVRRFGVKEPYTPEMVIDGAAQVSGNDGPAVQSALEKARGTAKIAVKISGVAVDNGKTVRAHLTVDALPADFKAKKADVVVAIALDHVETHVGAGENKGRDIRSVAVAESIEKVGTVEKGKGFDRDVTVKLKSGMDAGNLRVVAFVQGADTGEVMGVAMENPGKAGAAGGGAGGR